MAEIVAFLNKENPEIKTMIGGAPVNPDFARSIQAHYYGENAREAVVGAHELLGIPLET